ncbi:MAG: ATPase, T2SS/T4P/T4SS family [Vicinamibacterales bacterium]
MTFVPSLLQAIVLMDGDALVMHVGDRPYVVTDKGQASLASDPLSSDAIDNIIEQLLPEESQRVLKEIGATQCVLPEDPLYPRERFSVVAARGGDDVWVEIRRTGLQRRHGDGAATPSPRPTAAPSPAAMKGSTFAREGAPAVVDMKARQTARLDSDVQPAIVLPLTRTSLRADVPSPAPESPVVGLERLLRMALDRGGSTLYLVSGSSPAMRVDGEIRPLDGAPTLTPQQVDAYLRVVLPERAIDGLRGTLASEWTTEFAGLGRVRCVSFRDQRGPGGVFRILPQRAVTADRLGLAPAIQALAGEQQGLLCVTGPRLSGKRTLMAALVDHVNRTRHAHVITVERDLAVLHERVNSMVSQRETRGELSTAAAVQAALREDPDVLLIDDVRTAEVANLALEAAAGRLVICGFPATCAESAMDGFIRLSPPAEHQRVQLLLGHRLLGVVAQVLLKKSGGGRLAAREVLLNTPAVARLLADGQIAQLPLAIEAGRQYGMVPLNDAISAFARSGAVDVREAYLCAADRPALLAQLRRQGVDTSIIERLA